MNFQFAVGCKDQGALLKSQLGHGLKGGATLLSLYLQGSPSLEHRTWRYGSDNLDVRSQLIPAGTQGLDKF